MSHLGKSGPPDITDTYSLLVLNVTFRTTADDLFPLFDKYGEVVDIFIPRDKRTGESRGFAFVRYKYADEAQRAVERLDGRLVDGREIAVQFAKYGPNAERIHKGRIIEKVSRIEGRSRSRSPHRRYHDDYRRDREYRSRSRNLDPYERDRYQGRERNYRYRSRSHSLSPDYSRDRDRGHGERRPRRNGSFESASPSRRSPCLHRKRSPGRSPSAREESPNKHNRSKQTPTLQEHAADLQSPLPRRDDVIT